MPPPPPPSKSYLLVLDTDSEDSEEDSYRIRGPPRTPSYPSPVQDATPTRIISRSGPGDMNRITSDQGLEASRRRPHLIKDEDDDDDEDEVNTSAEFSEGMESPSHPSEDEKLSKNQKKKRARKRKKKRSKASSQEKSNNLSVSFSTVSVRIYPRSFSGDAVPADGGWPLGMDREPLLAVCPEDCSVEDYEAQKQEMLRERWESLSLSPKFDQDVADTLTKRPEGHILTFETRQWDYRSKLKNPLFGVMKEEDRQSLFLDATSLESPGPSSPSSKGRTRKNSFDHSASPSHKGRTRSSSFSHPSSSSPSKKGRSRSGSLSNAENFNETYNQVYVHHVRNELEQLRNQRTKSGATGCNCRKLTVYVPPKGGGGKKAQHRRLKPSKLTQELKKRDLYDASASREELERILHDAVAKEPCCKGEDCFCFRNGIDCQTDACSCWHDSHGHSKSIELLSIEDVKKRCGNPLGMTTVDILSIEAYRREIMDHFVCRPVGAAQ